MRLEAQRPAPTRPRVEMEASPTVQVGLLTLYDMGQIRRIPAMNDRPGCACEKAGDAMAPGAIRPPWGFPCLKLPLAMDLARREPFPAKACPWLGPPAHPCRASNPWRAAKQVPLGGRARGGSRPSVLWRWRPDAGVRGLDHGWLCHASWRLQRLEALLAGLGSIRPGPPPAAIGARIG